MKKPSPPPPKKKPLNIRQRRAALERMKDPIATEKAILIRSGYSPNTAWNPTAKGLNTTELVERYSREVMKISPAKARELGMTKLVELAQSSNEAVAGSAAKELVAIGDRAGAVDDSGITSDDVAKAIRRRRVSFVTVVCWTVLNQERAIGLAGQVMEKLGWETWPPWRFEEEPEVVEVGEVIDAEG